MKAGIYRITNKVNGNCYIGSSVDLQRRRRQHFNNLANDIHVNSHLQNAYNKYGDTSLEFEIIEYIEIDDNIKETLLEREQFWIDTINPEYNILPIAGSTLGFKHSEETKQKLSNSTKGVKKSKLHAQHIREAQKGKQLTDEHRKKLSEAAKRRKSMSHHTRISIDGTEYNSLKEASEITGIKYTTIQNRLRNPNFPTYIYIKD